MKKVHFLILAIVLAVLVYASALFYFKVQKENQIEVFNYQDLVVFELKKDDLPQWKQDEYFERFLRVRDIISQNADSFDALQELGSLHKALGNLAMAEKAWIYTGQIRPKNSPSFSSLGDLYANFLAEPEKAEAAYKTAIANSEGEPYNAGYSRQLFELYFYHFEDYPKTEEFLKERLEKYPDNLDYLSLLAYLYVKIDRRSEAIKLYERFLEIDPTDDAVEAALNALKQDLPK